MALLATTTQWTDAAERSPLCKAMDTIAIGASPYLKLARGPVVGVRGPQNTVAFGSPETETSYEAVALIPGSTSCVEVDSEYPGRGHKNFLRCQWPMGANGGKTLKALIATIAKCWPANARSAHATVDPVFSEGSIYVAKTGLEVSLTLKNTDSAITMELDPTAEGRLPN